MRLASFEAIIGALHGAEVRYLMAGGLAVGARGYAVVLAEVRRMIGDSRRRALASVNRVLVWLYWYIGRVIVAQQEKAAWGDAVVERFSTDLRAAFPDMKGLSRDNLFRMRQFYRTCCRTDEWLSGKVTLGAAEVGTPSRQLHRRDPEKCLPAAAEQGDLLPFKDHYLLDFLGLEESHIWKRSFAQPTVGLQRT